MCQLCNSKNLSEIFELRICNKIKEIPKELVNLECLSCSFSQVSEAPKELVNLQYLNCSYSLVSYISKELINLRILDCSCSQTTEISKELINLQILECSEELQNFIFDNIQSFPNLILVNNSSMKLNKIREQFTLEEFKQEKINKRQEEFNKQIEQFEAAEQIRLEEQFRRSEITCELRTPLN